MTTAANNPPQYANKPVILVHLTVQSNEPGYPDMYWCAPFEVVPTSEIPAYPNIPQIMCPSCAGFGMK
jgi:hypothetical protein